MYQYIQAESTVRDNIYQEANTTNTFSPFYYISTAHAYYSTSPVSSCPCLSYCHLLPGMFTWNPPNVDVGTRTGEQGQASPTFQKSL